MLRNYLKITWRSLWKNKVYSVLNISGLAIGMAVTLIIGLWVQRELSFDRFLPGYEHLYQVEINYISQQKGTVTRNAMAMPLLDVLRKEIPEIKNAVLCDWINEHNLLVGERSVVLDGAMIGSEFLTMFQYPMLKGNAVTALRETYSIVLTESTARALFGKEDPMNKLVKIDNRHHLTVTGVMKDLPGNSTLQFNYLIPFHFFVETTDWVKNNLTNWGNHSNQIFVELHANASLPLVNSKIKKLESNHVSVSTFDKIELFLHPLKDWRLYSDFKNGKAEGGFIDYVRMFSIIGVLVLFIACINFMNLSTARSSVRSKEVGVRKAIGSSRYQLIIQFLMESLMLATIAFFICLILVQLAIPYFNVFTNSAISIPFTNPFFWIIMLTYVFFTGILAGTRPAFYLSSFQPSTILKGTIRSGKTNVLSRKLLVVIQFSCSIALIISTLIVYEQIQHAQNRYTGYNRSRLMSTYLNTDLEKHYEALKQDLLQSGLIEGVAKASSPMTTIFNHVGFKNWPGKSASDEQIRTGLIWVSPDYFTTMQIKIKTGKDFSNTPVSDTLSIVVNEAAIKAMNLKEEVNQLIKLDRNESGYIIGIAENVIMRSPYSPVIPVVYALRRWDFHTDNFIFYRLKPTVDVQKAIPILSKLFAHYNVAYPHSYRFVDTDYQEKFRMEVLVGKLSAIFSGIAIFISCLGLFGLTAYTAEQRVKEIGVRKVMGASILQLWLLLCKDFVILVLISCIIASPVAFYFLQKWLQNYDYRISIKADVFIISSVIGLFIALVTTSFQAVKAAAANPVKSLRAE